MLFGKRQLEKVSKSNDGSYGQSYWSMVRRQFKKNRLAVWSLRVLYGLVFIALLGDVIANEKPLYCQVEGQTYFPVFRQYLVDLGLAKWDAKFINNDWADQNYEAVVFPLIPYSAKTLDLRNTIKGPFDKQEVRTQKQHHYLGTDHVGRDIAAGMIRGVRVALIVGIVSMGVATIIGLLLGGVAGFFGDDQLFVSKTQLGLNLLGIFLGLFYGFGARSFAISEGHFVWEVFLGSLIFILVLVLMNILTTGMHRVFPPKKKIALPLDLIIMRFIEVINSIPGLILILSLLAVMENSSIVNVMVIIGLIGWTGIAKFVRSELLRVRSLDYIEAARSLGINDWRILIRHAIPNALTPILISIAFGIAGAILLEAFLSFLGIGMPPEEVTWGRILFYSRENVSAWWMAIFPGVAIFLTVTIFNLIGEGLTDALNPKLKK